MRKFETSVRRKETYNLCIKKGYFKRREGSVARKVKGKVVETMWFQREDFKALLNSKEVDKLVDKFYENNPKYTLTS